MITVETHAHERVGLTVRRFAGIPGIWVLEHGEWVRPMNVWRYRGAWRVHCRICYKPLQSGLDVYGQGWADQESALAAAEVHCHGCPDAGKWTPTERDRRRAAAVRIRTADHG